MNNFRQSGTVAGSQSTTSTLKPKKTSRFVRLYERAWAHLTSLYRFGRKSMWVLSTCTPNRHLVLILMFLPLAFGYMSEVEAEIQKMSAPGGSNHSIMQSTRLDVIDNACRHLSIHSLRYTNRLSNLYAVCLQRMQVFDYACSLVRTLQSVERHVRHVEHRLRVLCG